MESKIFATVVNALAGIALYILVMQLGLLAPPVFIEGFSPPTASSKR